MHLAARLRQRDGVLALRHRLHHARHQIARQQRRIAGCRHDPARVRCVAGRPAHAGQHPGQRADEAFDRVGHHRQREGCKAPRITVGVDDGRGNLRGQPVDDVAQHRLARQLEQALVTAAHPPRPATRQNHARHGRSCMLTGLLQCMASACSK
jgi:hypothetical protein